MLMLTYLSNVGCKLLSLVVLDSAPVAAVILCVYQGTLNLREWTLREWTIRHDVAGVENAGVDNAAPCGKSGQCGSGQCRSGEMRVKMCNIVMTGKESMAY